MVRSSTVRGWILGVLAGAAGACGSAATQPAPAADVVQGLDAVSGQDAAAAEDGAAGADADSGAGADSGADSGTGTDAEADTAGQTDASTDVSADVAADVAADVSTPQDTAAVDAPPSDVPAGVVQGSLVEAGWSFGECMSSCKGVLKLQGAQLVFDIDTNPGGAVTEYKGILTTGAAAELQDLEAKLAGKALQSTYGCPDCADGGSAWVSFSDGVTTTQHVYEFGKPPAELAGVDALVKAAMAALKACTGDATVVIQGACPADTP